MTTTDDQQIALQLKEQVAKLVEELAALKTELKELTEKYDGHRHGFDLPGEGGYEYNHRTARPDEP